MADPNDPQIAIASAVHLLRTFRGPDLTQTIREIEKSLKGVSVDGCSHVLARSGVKNEVLGTAGLVKQLAGQIDVVVHTLGILLCLPRILKPGEIIEYASLGAGNTKRKFDLETNRRIAEFKFIRWQGGSESIRQNSLFKDFYGLAEQNTQKDKFLCVLGTEHGDKFFNGGRALESVLSRNDSLKKSFNAKYQNRFMTVRDYYHFKNGSVVIQDVSALVPELMAVAIDAAETEEE
jgi:hypothetical protein